MTGCIGLFILFGIVIFIAILGMKNKQNRNRTVQFYEQHSLIPITEIPTVIFEVFNNQVVYCRQGNLQTTNSETVPFFWCEWSIQSMISSGTSRQISTDYYLAAAFSPAIVSEEFERKAISFTDKSDEDFSQKAKDFFVLNTEKPYRAEKLSDGSFLICWRVKNLAEDYERDFAWLQNNISAYKKEEKAVEIKENLPLEVEVKTEIQRLPIEQFLEEMAAENYNKSRDIINVTDSIIWNYHDTKGNSNMSSEDHAKFLQMSLEEVETASKAITEIKFPVDEFLAKGFQIPELLKYEYQLAYRLNFPSRTLIYLDRAKIFLDDSSPLKVYFR